MRLDGTRREEGVPDVGSMIWFSIGLLFDLALLGFCIYKDPEVALFLTPLWLFSILIFVGEIRCAYIGEDTYSY